MSNSEKSLVLACCIIYSFMSRLSLLEKNHRCELMVSSTRAIGITRKMECSVGEARANS